MNSNVGKREREREREKLGSGVVAEHKHNKMFASPLDSGCFSGLVNLWVTASVRDVARILGKGVLDYAHEARVQNFKPRPLINR